MPRLRLTRAARRDVERLRQFLESKNPEASKRAAQAIKNAIKAIAKQPEAHRPVPEMMFHREVIIAFGSSGYIARYFYKPGTDEIILLRIKHHLEDELTEDVAPTYNAPL